MAYINPPGQSKINKAQKLGFAAIALVLIAPESAPLVQAFAPDLMGVIEPFQDPKIQALASSAIGMATQAVTYVFRTWFTAK